MAKKNQKRWVYSPKATPKPKVPEATKKSVQVVADKLLEDVLKPQYVKSAPAEPSFNYIVDLYTKWYRNYFYFCATYRCPAENCISEFFETKYTRLEYTAKNQYTMSYMRHTGKWQEVYYDLPLETCLLKVESDMFFQP